MGFCVPVFADEEAPKTAHVTASENGSIYAKSVPDEYDWENRSNGKTFVYEVSEKKDKLLYTYDWFAQEIYLLDNFGSLVRLGPWARGHEPNKGDLAIGFYLDGKKLKEYSTLDIVNMAFDDKMNIGMSISHYDIFSEVIGYRFLRWDKWAFDVKTNEGKILSFDVSTGNLKTEEEEKHDEIIKKIEDLKGRCYEKSSKLANEDEYKHLLTVEAFKDCIGDEFPQIPKGYKLYLGTFFDDVKLEKSK